MEIAVLVGEDGTAAPIQAASELRVYKQSCNTWEIDRSLPFNISSARDLKAMRDYMLTIIEFLGDCRTWACLSISGIVFFELEKNGFTVWEMDGAAYAILDAISADTAAADSTPSLPIAVVKPEAREISPGYYSVSVKDIQNCNGMITSKQILLPLLGDKSIHKLEIVCTHIPPWLELKIVNGELEAQIEQTAVHETRVTISR